jgi:hypothetical protein
MSSNRNGTRFVFGVMLLALSSLLAIIGLFDAGVWLALGADHTLSHHLGEMGGVDDVGTVLITGIVTSLAFMAGMLATHFTNFRM